MTVEKESAGQMVPPGQAIILKFWGHADRNLFVDGLGADGSKGAGEGTADGNRCSHWAVLTDSRGGLGWGRQMAQ